MMAQSTPTMSYDRPSGPGGGFRTMSFHQASFTLRFSSVPSGP